MDNSNCAKDGKRTCGTCMGTGKEISKGVVKSCGTCGGSGQVSF